MPNSGSSTGPERSNVVLITAHNLGQHLGCYGVETVDTPNLDALAESGHRENTIVVFAADHGIPYPGAKWWCRSAGVEVATIVDGPGPPFEAEGAEEALLSNVDVVPTLLDALDLPVPDAVEGVSFRPYLAGETGDPPREAVFTQFQASSSRGVVTEEYNPIRNFGAGREVEYPVEASPSSRGPSDTTDPLPYAQLYDREADPHELADVAGEREAAVADLSDRLLEWMFDVEDPILRGPVAEPYYDRAMEALLAGGAERDRPE